MSTIKSMRLHIGILGQTNAGKSTLLNTITKQNVSIVSAQAGTTTDPVEKPMELKPFGPVLFIDTAGYEDYSNLGQVREKKTNKYLDRLDVAIVVIHGTTVGESDKKIVQKLRLKKIPLCVCLPKIHSDSLSKSITHWLHAHSIPFFINDLHDSREQFLHDFVSCLQKVVSPEWNATPKMITDFTKPGDIIVLVIPIDKEAPKNRIILPQQQAIRDVLDQGSISIVTGVSELANVLRLCKQKPSLVVTDSQAFKEVFSIVPPTIPVTGFSVLLARMKGDLEIFLRGIGAIQRLDSGDRVLILEACSHNPFCNDIGREQIPHGIVNMTNKNIEFDVVSGHDFPESLSNYKLIIHCGGCILNRKEIQNRIQIAIENNVPITNYGFVLSYMHGDLGRALEILMRSEKKEDLIS